MSGPDPRVRSQAADVHDDRVHERGVGRVGRLGVQDFLNRTEPQIIECYMKTLEDPSSADDSVQLQFVIDGAGKVTRVVARQSSITDVAVHELRARAHGDREGRQRNRERSRRTRDYTFRPAK
jgi:hypothetical protein